MVIDYSRFEALELSSDDEAPANEADALAAGIAAADTAEYGSMRAATHAALARGAAAEEVGRALRGASAPGDALARLHALGAAARSKADAGGRNPPPGGNEDVRAAAEAAFRAGATKEAVMRALQGADTPEKALAALADVERAARAAPRDGESEWEREAREGEGRQAQASTSDGDGASGGGRAGAGSSGGSSGGGGARVTLPVDPSTLERWPEELAVHPRWIAHSFAPHERSLAEAESELRQTLMLIAGAYSGCVEGGEIDETDTRARPEARVACFTLQNEDRSMGVVVEVVGARRCTADGAPLLEVMWAQHTRRQVEADGLLAAGLATMFERMKRTEGGGGGVTPIAATADEMELLTAMLERNQCALPRTYVASQLVGREFVLQCSFVVPPLCATHEAVLAAPARAAAPE